MGLGGQEGGLSQGVLGDAVQRGGTAGRVLIDGALPVADLMHGAHDGELGQATGVEVLDQVEVLGQVVQVGVGGVLETVAPGHVQDDVGAPHLIVDIRVPGEELQVDPLSPLVDVVEPQVEGLDSQAPLQQCGDDVAADVAAGSSDENCLCHGSGS